MKIAKEEVIMTRIRDLSKLIGTNKNQEELIMQKNDLQAEIKALQEYRREADILIGKINSVTAKMESDVVNDIEKIKKQIVKDLKELFSYVSPDIDATQSISVKDFVERDENGSYPLAYFSIKFGQKIYSMDSNTGLTQYEIAIVEDRYTDSAIYADGHWADEYPNSARQRNYGRDKNIQTVVEVLCRNWDSILEGAYQKIKEAYRKDTEKKLQETLQKNTEVQVRRSRLNENGTDELDVYMEMLEAGINVPMVRKYMGNSVADAMQNFCEEHGLI